MGKHQMSAQPNRHLQPAPEPVDPALVVLNIDTGEQLPLGNYVQQLQDEIAGLTRDVRAEHLRFENLKRDKAVEAREHPLWPRAIEVFKHWKEKCKHPRCEFGPGRFEEIRPFLERHDVDTCKLAVEGAAFDPFVTTRKNGSKKRHDGWGLIFRNAEPDKFEEFVNKAPRRAPTNLLDNCSESK